MLVGLCLLAPLSWAAEKTDKKGTPAPAAAPSKPQAANTAKPKMNPITEAASKAGIKSCAGRIDQLSNFLTADTQSGWMLFQPNTKPDQNLITVSMEAATKGVSNAYVSETFAPNQANGCGGMYESVIFWESGCQDVAKKQFANFKAAGVLSKNISILDGGAGLKVFLMPAGRGCVTIKKEVVQ